MPFSSKYPSLGPTSPLRIPHILHSHVLHIVAECERLCVTHDEDYVLHILDKVTEGLDNIPWTITHYSSHFHHAFRKSNWSRHPETYLGFCYLRHQLAGGRCCNRPSRPSSTLQLIYTMKAHHTVLALLTSMITIIGIVGMTHKDSQHWAYETMLTGLISTAAIGGLVVLEGVTD